MAATLTQPTRHSDSERLRRRRDRLERLEPDRVMTEVAFELRARVRRDRGLDLGGARSSARRAQADQRLRYPPAV